MMVWQRFRAWVNRLLVWAGLRRQADVVPGDVVWVIAGHRAFKLDPPVGVVQEVCVVEGNVVHVTVKHGAAAPRQWRRWEIITAPELAAATNRLVALLGGTARNWQRPAYVLTRTVNDVMEYDTVSLVRIAVALEREADALSWEADVDLLDAYPDEATRTILRVASLPPGQRLSRPVFDVGGDIYVMAH